MSRNQPETTTAAVPSTNGGGGLVQAKVTPNQIETVFENPDDPRVEDYITNKYG